MRRQRDGQLTVPTGTLRGIGPPFVVGTGIAASGVPFQPEALALHPPTKGEAAQRVDQLVLHGLQLLLGHGGIEDGAVGIMMEESEAVGHRHDTVRAGL